MKKRILNKDFVWNALGLTFNAFNSLLFLIVVKLINGLDEAGIFTYAFSLCCLFYVIALFYNRTYQVSDNDEDFCFWDYLAFRLTSAGISFVAVLFFCFASQFNWEKIVVIVALMVFRIIEAISDCFYGEMQKRNALYKSGISLSIKAILGFVVFLLIDIRTRNVLLSIFGLTIVNILVFSFYDLPQVKSSLQEKVSINKQNIRNLFKVTWPVFVFSLLATFLANCQKYILTYFASNDIQAIFGIIVMPATMLGLVGTYLINPFVLRLTILKEKKKWEDFFILTRNLVIVFSGIGAIGLVICGIVGVPILNLIYQIDLSEQWINLNIIVLSAVISAIGMILSNILTILKRNKSQVTIYLVATLLACSTSAILIPVFGINGAVISYLVSNLLVSGGFALTFSREWRKVKK